MNHVHVWANTYVLGNLATFIFLILEGIGDVHGLLYWLLYIMACEIQAMIWPVYWGLIRWVF
jgi:hypothetical protein